MLDNFSSQVHFGNVVEFLHFEKPNCVLACVKKFFLLGDGKFLDFVTQVGEGERLQKVVCLVVSFDFVVISYNIENVFSVEIKLTDQIEVVLI